jgi:hypothetical protein
MLDATKQHLNYAQLHTFNHRLLLRSLCYESLLQGTDFATAAERAFSTKITGIKPTAERFNILQGIHHGSINYIHIDAKASFINITGHEIYHDLAAKV